MIYKIKLLGNNKYIYVFILKNKYYIFSNIYKM